MASTDSHIFPSSQYGFMELLGLQDLSSYFYCDNSSLLLDDTLLDQHQAPPKKMASPMVVSTAVDSSQEITNNQPATPNASSISSASSEAAAKNEMQLKAAEEEGEDEGCMKRQREEDGDGEPKTKKKAVGGTKKAKEKKQREPRFAFMTKSEVDLLEDGYRWRKYGQKAVKNSSFPRSYYRCTIPSCNVKKRVERLHTDPAVVVTTYEGQHIHPSPLLVPHHYALVRPPPEYSAFSGGAGTAFPVEPHVSTHHQGGPYYSSPTASILSSVRRPSHALLESTSAAALRKRRFCPHDQSATAGLMIGDGHGLLEDIVRLKSIRKTAD